MKKILIIGTIILSVFLIYLTTIDKKVYYLSLGDEIALGMTKEGYYEKSYTNYIKEYLENKNKLEIYINQYETQGYRITDIINDIKNNKEIEETNTTIKNALIKADLLTISIGNNDIKSKINETKELTNIDYNNLNKNINTIINDLNNLLKLIREYCKEDIVMIGINIKTDDEKINNMIKTANEKIEEICKNYNIKYINIYNKIDIYPTKEKYEKLGNIIIEEINLLKK